MNRTWRSALAWLCAAALPLPGAVGCSGSGADDDEPMSTTGTLATSGGQVSTGTGASSGVASSSVTGTGGTGPATTGPGPGAGGQGPASTGATGGAGGGEAGGGGEGGQGEPFDGVLDVLINAHNTCTIATSPASITVPEGTSFTVRWVNLGVSDVEVDIDKIDSFNQVPLIIGLEPGMSWHDDIRQWCAARCSPAPSRSGSRAATSRTTSTSTAEGRRRGSLRGA